MLYNSSNPVDADRAKRRLKVLTGKGAVFELTEKKAKRSISQNSYLHILLGYFAAESGNTLEYVKQKYFKTYCNPELFIREHTDPYLGQTHILRSSTELDTAEMTEAISRFRHWASQEAGIYLPEPHESVYLTECEKTIIHNKEFL